MITPTIDRNHSLADLPFSLFRRKLETAVRLQHQAETDRQTRKERKKPRPQYR